MSKPAARLSSALHVWSRLTDWKWMVGQLMSFLLRLMRMNSTKMTARNTGKIWLNASSKYFQQNSVSIFFSKGSWFLLVFKWLSGGPLTAVNKFVFPTTLMLTVQVLNLQPLFCAAPPSAPSPVRLPQWQATKHLVLHVKKESSASAQLFEMLNFPAEMQTRAAKLCVWMCDCCCGFVCMRAKCMHDKVSGTAAV